MMRNFEGRVENMSTIYLIDSHGTLVGAVPLVKIVLAPPPTPLLVTQDPSSTATKTPKRRNLPNSSTNTTC